NPQTGRFRCRARTGFDVAPAGLMRLLRADGYKDTAPAGLGVNCPGQPDSSSAFPEKLAFHSGTYLPKIADSEARSDTI
ncbi:MAG: hypothetical protein ACP5MD_06840, partial [Verrucomicrobiia bacterium]